MSFFEQINLVDGTVLFSNAAVTATGNLTSFATTSYQSVQIQVVGTGTFVIETLGSIDNVNFPIPLSVQAYGDLQQIDTITNQGIFSLKSPPLYLKFNIISITGSAAITVVGRMGEGLAAADSLSASFDASNPIAVAIQNLKKDPNNALMLSDSISQTFYIGLTTPLIIDTTGYKSLDVTTNALLTAGITFSSDGVTWNSGIASPPSAMNWSPNLAATTNYVIPCFGQLVRIIATVAGTLTIVKRNVDIHNVPGWASAGQTGVPSVGGPGATGAAPVGYPVSVGGVEPATGFTRRIVTDSTGRLVYASADTVGVSPVVQPLGVGGIDQLNLVRRLGVSLGASPINIPPLMVQENSLTEGQSVGEILLQILFELKITNQQLYEMVPVLQNGTGANSLTAPESYRNDPSMFAFQT